ALHEGGGVAVDHPAYQRGVEFLLRTQLADGSWFVASRSFPIVEYSKSGFPHGRSQFISASATCWATMALTLTTPTSPQVQSSASHSRRALGATSRGLDGDHHPLAPSAASAWVRPTDEANGERNSRHYLFEVFPREPSENDSASFIKLVPLTSDSLQSSNA